jgi:glycosyltransferase involved in cell wall biosynthesis
MLSCLGVVQNATRFEAFLRYPLCEFDLVRQCIADEIKPGHAMDIVVLIPCYNEAATIGTVVTDLRRALPQAVVYVYDNNSSDGTAEIARAAGAIVRHEPLQGKGNTVRRMFADVDADVYVLIDGDDTYDAASAPTLVEKLIDSNLDMVSASRAAVGSSAYRPGHRFGNALLTGIVRLTFGARFQDMLTGYRVVSRRFAKSFPALSEGFEIETELTIHALDLNMPAAEVETPYKERPHGSFSKLKTYSDGVRILRMILVLIKEEKPLAFFFIMFVILASVSILLGIPIIETFMETGLVPRFPTAILAMGLMLLAFLSLTSGLILDTVTRGRKEIKRLHYLSIPAVRSCRDERKKDERQRASLP